MTYTVAWNESLPLGSDPASSIDTYIQQDKIAVRERLDDIFGTSGVTGWATADPYRPIKFKLSGAVDTFIIPGSTSISIRDSTDTHDNFKVLENGSATLRNALTITAGGLTVTAGSATITAGGLTVTAGASSFGGNATFSKQVAATPVDIGDKSSNFAVDWNAGVNQLVRLTGGPVTITFTNPVAGAIYTLKVKKDATPRVYTISGVQWAGSVTPGFSSTASRSDLYSFFYDGTAYIGVQVGIDYNA